MPSHAAQDLSAERIALSRGDLRARTSGDFCRWDAHSGIVDAILYEASRRVQIKQDLTVSSACKNGVCQLAKPATLRVQLERACFDTD